MPISIKETFIISIIAWIDSHFYPNYGKNWEDDQFRQLILKELFPEFNVLDMGAGAGIVPQMNFKNFAKHVCGVDPDPRVENNLYLDEGRIGRGENIPWPDNTFDLIFSDNVLEHLTEPQKVFAEIGRVLKPGGVFLAKTPNKWHYVPLIAKLTPLWFHKVVVSWRGRKGEDVFPTRYRANTATDISRLASMSGLKLIHIDYIDGRPEYLRFSFFTYLIGILYERIVSSSSFLRFFRVVLFARIIKPRSEDE